MAAHTHVARLVEKMAAIRAAEAADNAARSRYPVAGIMIGPRHVYLCEDTKGPRWELTTVSSYREGKFVVTAFTDPGAAAAAYVAAVRG